MFFPNNKLFIHIPKTGGSSLEYAISSKYYSEQIEIDESEENYKSFINENSLKGIERKKIEEISYNKYTVNGYFRNLKKGEGGHPHSYIKEYAEFLDLNNYEKFVILRNPYDQVISLYNQMRKQVKITSLNDFIMCTDKHNIKKYRHYIDQYAFTHIDEKFYVDKVFIFDRYHEAQEYVEDTFGLKIDRSIKLWKTEYNDETLSESSKCHFEEVFSKSIDLYNSFA